MVCNIQQYFEGNVEKLDWEAVLPNPETSDEIQIPMFYGRAIRVPGNRVFVISGSISDTSTNTLTDQVQEWDLNTLTVRVRPPIPLARTSFGCYLHGIHIYVVGGNCANSISTSQVHRFNIVSQKWEELPKMVMHRANAGTLVYKGFLYAFGGF